MKFNYFILLTFVAFFSCSRPGSGEKTSYKVSEEKEQISPDMTGQWFIENIVFNDSTYVRPAEEVPGSRQYITFEDNSFSIITNCNAISGSYSLKGDSIKFGDGAFTEIACDNMATEDALRKILPDISTVDVNNDSIVRLNCIDASSYIVLHKSPIQVKCHVK